MEQEFTSQEIAFYKKLMPLKGRPKEGAYEGLDNRGTIGPPAPGRKPRAALEEYSPILSIGPWLSRVTLKGERISQRAAGKRPKKQHRKRAGL